jgi:hypothetical protein
VSDSETEREVGGVIEAAPRPADGANEWLSPTGSDLPLAAPLPSGPGSPRVSLEAEVPEALFEGMREFIRNHPQWDQYSVITSALAGFLFQNGARDRCVKDHYLAGLFSDVGTPSNHRRLQP